MEIDIYIDVLADCLICAETGEACATEYCRVHRTITENEAVCLNTQGWRFNWNIMYIDSYASKRLVAKYFKEEYLW